MIYHFSSVDPTHQGCAAHGSNDELASSEGLQRLLDFREAVENSFCCGASVDLLLIGIDTDTDAIRVHTPSKLTEQEAAKSARAEVLKKKIVLEESVEPILAEIFRLYYISPEQAKTTLEDIFATTISYSLA